MLDFEGVVGFQWDHGNARKNEKHAVSQGEAEQVFFDADLLVTADPAHSVEEPRYHALGATRDGRRLHITFTLRERMTRIRVTSAHDMHRSARRIYERQG